MPRNPEIRAIFKLAGMPLPGDHVMHFFLSLMSAPLVQEVMLVMEVTAVMMKRKTTLKMSQPWPKLHHLLSTIVSIA